jgi:HAE1 family hydrophobic/amphiphilic exporter-1
MTTLCTLVGLLPLALGLGTGAEMHRPLAVAVLGGLSLSTLGTLYTVPAVYALLRRPRAQEDGKNGKGPATKPPPQK